MSYESVLAAESSLIYWWPLSDTTSTATDHKGTDNGNYSGTYTQGVPGLPGSGLLATSFNSGSVYTNSALADSLPLTIEVWFTTTATDGALLWFQNGRIGFTGQFNPGLGVGGGYRGTSGTGKVGFYDFNTTPSSIDGPVVDDGHWHHAVGSITPSSYAFYVDNALIGSGSGSSQVLTGAYWRMGDQGGSWPWNGKMAHVAVYNSALTALQVTTHYYAGLAPGTTFSVRDPLATRIPGIN